MKLHFSIIILFGLLSTLNAKAHKSTQYSKTNKLLEKKYGNLVGMKVKNVIEHLNLDTTQFYASEEPPMILSSFNVEIEDTLEISFHVEGTPIFDKPGLPFRQEYKYIEHKKVKRISIYDKKANIIYYLKN